MALRLQKKEVAPSSMGAVDGLDKQTWTETGIIDFFVPQVESADPQMMTLRVQEEKITQDATGRKVGEYRWRPATLELAKKVIAHWNACKEYDRRG